MIGHAKEHEERMCTSLDARHLEIRLVDCPDGRASLEVYRGAVSFSNVQWQEFVFVFLFR